MSQLQIDKWAQGKPLFLAILCQQMACCSDELHEILSFARHQEHIHGLPEANPKDWLKLYRNHRRQEKCAINAFRELGGAVADSAELYKYLRSRSRNTRTAIPEHEQLAEAEATLLEFYRKNLAQLESELKDHPLDEETRSKVEKYFLNQEFLFLFKVHLPCLLLHGTLPAILFRQARLGNLKAIEKLLRLDKIVLSDPVIMRQAQQLLHKNKPKYESAIAKPILGVPKFKHSPRASTIRLAGIISRISTLLGHKLTAPEIRKLFHAVALDRSTAELARDADLPESDQAFSKSLQRKKA